MARPLTKKSDLIEAALTLFMKKGIKATTTRDIALRANISEGTIYRHFQSKAELAAVIFEQNLDYFWNFLKGYLKKTSNPEEMLTAFIHGIFEFARREQKRYSFIISAHQTELKRHSREKMKPRHMLAKIIRLGQKRGYFRQMDPSLASAMILGTIVQTIFYLKNGTIPVNFDDVIHEVSQSCLKMIRKEPKERR